MRPGNFEDLAALRARHFGFTLDFVARRTGLQPERLRAIEAGDDPTVYELDRVAAVYGIEDADVLLGAPIQLPLGDSLTLLAQHAEFREVSNETRAQLLTASQAARDVVALRAILGEPDAAAILQKRARPSAPKRRATPFDEGARRAHWLRTEELAVGSEPIPSMRDLVAERFPEITTLYAHLGLDGVAGLAFGDRVRGPTIVLNLDGKNTNPLVRRFSLAHELARLLFDWNRAEPFGQLSGFKDDGRLTVEQSANAFAMRLLCPEMRLRRLAKTAEPMDAALALAREWGIHFEAARLYLQKAAGVEVPRDPSQALLAAQARATWASAEDPEIDSFPLLETPPERRSVVARLAATAYARGLLSRDRFARLLGVTPAADVERVLDLYSLDAPLAA